MLRPNTSAMHELLFDIITLCLNKESRLLCVDQRLTLTVKGFVCPGHEVGWKESHHTGLAGAPVLMHYLWSDKETP